MREESVDTGAFSATSPDPLVLRRRAEVTLRPKAPFHFVATVHKPSHFPTPTEVFHDDRLWFTMTWRGSVLGIRIAGAKGSAVPVTLYAARPIPKAEAAEIGSELTFRFGMHLDLTGFTRMAKRDPVLRPVEARWRGMRPSCAYALFELLCITTVLQNATVRRSADMLQRLLDTYGQPVRFAHRTLQTFFPPARIAAATEEELRLLKVGYRAKALRRIAAFFAAHEKFEGDLRRRNRIETMARLREIYGVGPASAWYLLFEAFKHVDAFDYVSPWEAKILGRLLFDDEGVRRERIVQSVTERWGDWRMLAVHYLFEDVFWKRRTESIPWLDRLIRL